MPVRPDEPSDAELLQQRNRELAILNSIAQVLNGSVDLDTALRAALAQVAALATPARTTSQVGGCRCNQHTPLAQARQRAFVRHRPRCRRPGCLFPGPNPKKAYLQALDNRARWSPASVSGSHEAAACQPGCKETRCAVEPFDTPGSSRRGGDKYGQCVIPGEPVPY